MCLHGLYGSVSPTSLLKRFRLVVAVMFELIEVPHWLFPRSDGQEENTRKLNEDERTRTTIHSARSLTTGVGYQAAVSTKNSDELKKYIEDGIVKTHMKPERR